eukprot:jgi/Botrbrau1/14871/Bobra.0298s0005.1
MAFGWVRLLGSAGQTRLLLQRHKASQPWAGAEFRQKPHAWMHVGAQIKVRDRREGDGAAEAWEATCTVMADVAEPVGNGSDARGGASRRWEGLRGDRQESLEGDRQDGLRGTDRGGARGEAVAAWNRIRQMMKPPKCRGHGEECVVRHVKKAGANQGRVFYVCARPDGPKPHGRCDHFAWASERSLRGTQPDRSAPAKKARR